MPIVSIIVPVYKVEKYLSRCLDSILAQTFTDFECILVDDGSPDNCPIICDEYAKKDKRITVIHKKNMGLAAARNSGLNKSVGKFIAHIDSDDWVEPNALELLYKKQEETDADIVIGGLRKIMPYSTHIFIPPVAHKSMSSVAYFLFYIYNSLCAKLYKRNLFLDYIVPNSNVGEDAIVNVQIFSKVKIENIHRIENIIYNYDNMTCGIVNNMPKIYKSYLDNPDIASMLWIEQYLCDAKQDYQIEIASLYNVYKSIIYHILNNYDNVTRNDVEIFYKNYHIKFVNSEYRNIVLVRHRIIIPMLYLFMPLGRTYVKILKILAYIKRKLRLLKSLR